MKSVIKTNKQNLYKSFLTRKTPESKEIYLNYKNKLTKLIRISMKSYFASRFSSIVGNMKQTWKLINKILTHTLGENTNAGPKEILVNGVNIKDPTIIADKFNEYFTNIGPDLAAKIPFSSSSIILTMPPRNNSSMFIQPCNSEEIISITNSLTNSKSTGLDKLPVYIIKE